MSLLNQLPRVSDCLSAQLSFECPVSTQVPKCLSAQALKCSSALSTQVLKRPSSARTHKYPKIALGVPLEHPLSAQFPI